MKIQLQTVNAIADCQDNCRHCTDVLLGQLQTVADFCRNVFFVCKVRWLLRFVLSGAVTMACHSGKGHDKNKSLKLTKIPTMFCFRRQFKLIINLQNILLTSEIQKDFKMSRLVENLQWCNCKVVDHKWVYLPSTDQVPSRGVCYQGGYQF